MQAELYVGMERVEVEALLGPPAYCPSEGLCNYVTGSGCKVEADSGGEGGTFKVACGYVIDYGQDSPSRLTTTAQSCWWGALGE